MTTVDEGFLARVYKTSAVVWAIGCVVCAVYFGWMAALGWTAGSVLSAGAVYSLEQFVRRTIVPGSQETQPAFLKFYLMKSVGFMGFLVIAVLAGGRSMGFIVAFVVGVALLQGVMILKVLGIIMTDKLRR